VGFMVDEVALCIKELRLPANQVLKKTRKLYARKCFPLIFSSFSVLAIRSEYYHVFGGVHDFRRGFGLLDSLTTYRSYYKQL
jgi:hypothetical protein